MATDISAEINYFAYTTDNNSAWLEAGSRLAEQRSNFKQIPARVAIHDLRGKEKSVNLDTNAFELLNYDESMQELFEDESEAQKAHYDEMSNLLKKYLNASQVIVYHHVFRNRNLSNDMKQCDQHHRNPAFDPHVDIDEYGIREKIKQMFGKEQAEKLMEKCFQAVNIWRPLGKNPITTYPLAICDYRSINLEKDVHSIELRGSVNTSTAYMMSRHNQDEHMWYYLSNMKSNEMFIFKMFDSQSDVAQYAFHTAVKNENATPSNDEQTSLEMRCLIFYDK
ncbi:unnamed protein product [Adineta steineri]|uniref:Methyltransferase n=1 Tax=Adineta steineri TaxID=433720 RepID=A0A819VCY2_9BILA|nr:unnamed protein product [Adineta steineri]CAF4107068.1 unnamed protein product [Adineta steineri]